MVLTWKRRGRESQFAGVAAVIRNSTHKYLKHVIPHSPRMMEVQLDGAAPITILNIYAPKAERPQEENEHFYDKMQSTIKKINNKLALPDGRGLECKDSGS